MMERTASRLRGGRRSPHGLVALLFAACFVVAGDASSQSLSFTPLQISLLPVAQIFPEDLPVRGFRLNLYGRQQVVAGLDAGFFNEVRQNVTGIGAGIEPVVWERQRNSGRDGQFGRRPLSGRARKRQRRKLEGRADRRVECQR